MQITFGLIAIEYNKLKKRFQKPHMFHLERWSNWGARRPRRKLLANYGRVIGFDGEWIANYAERLTDLMILKYKDRTIFVRGRRQNDFG